MRTTETKQLTEPALDITLKCFQNVLTLFQARDLCSVIY